MQIAMQIAELQAMTLIQLQAKWSEYFDTPPFSQNKEFYVSRIAYRIQELAYGGIPYEQQQFIAKLYIEPKNRAEHIPTGTRITREYLGVEYIVTVLRDGFEYNGLKYKTLSGIAKIITGRKISGRNFFKLDQR